MTLTPQDEAQRQNTPPLQGRGRGRGLSANRLSQLNGYARDMRNEPTEPEKRLWRRLSNRQLGGVKFRRQAVIGQVIVDFLCPEHRLIVEVDGDTHDAMRDRVRDGALEQQGFRVVRITNAAVMREMDGVLTLILSALNLDSPSADSPHPNPSPEGEGLR